MNTVLKILFDSSLSGVVIITTIIIQVCTNRRQKKEITISAINELQKTVFDNLVHVNKENAITIVENIDDENCKTAYNDYRVMIARLDQFAIAVKERIYNYRLVNKMIGNHLIQIKDKIAPIIDATNERGSSNNYTNYLWLVQNLEKNMRK